MKFVACALVGFAFACGSAGSSGPPGGDDDNPADAPSNTVDSPTTPVVGLGTTCTPDQANPQGTCPAGFTCLNLMDGTNPWCSKTCQTGANDACATDYSGPGKAQCVFQITPAGGGAAENFCAVICMDNTGNNQLCPATQCTGTCPGTLACTAPLSDGTNTVANACE
jgi:hypothetical protein